MIPGYWLVTSCIIIQTDLAYKQTRVGGREIPQYLFIFRYEVMCLSPASLSLMWLLNTTPTGSSLIQLQWEPDISEVFRHMNNRSPASNHWYKPDHILDCMMTTVEISILLNSLELTFTEVTNSLLQEQHLFSSSIFLFSSWIYTSKLPPTHTQHWDVIWRGEFPYSPNCAQNHI